jgi:hypothetical protein
MSLLAERQAAKRSFSVPALLRGHVSAADSG